MNKKFEKETPKKKKGRPKKDSGEKAVETKVEKKKVVRKKN